MRRQREEAGRRQPEKRTGTMQFEEIRRRLLSLLENRDELSDQDRPTTAGFAEQNGRNAKLNGQGSF